MANPQKPTFSFGQPASSGTPGTSQPPSSGIFGSASNPPSFSVGSGLFSGTTTTSGAGIGPATSGSSSVFGGSSGVGGGSNMSGGANKPAPGGINFTPASSNNPPGTGIFSSTPASSQTPQPGNTSTTSAPSILATPSKPNESSNNRTLTPNQQFGETGNQGGSSFFSNLGSNNPSTTPTSKPMSSFFGNSTTPAGPPPATSAGASSSAPYSFGKPQGQDTPSLFSNLGQASSNASTNATTSSAAPAGIFDKSNKGGSNIFGNQATAQGGGGLFSNLNQQQGSGTANKATSSQPVVPTSTATAGAQPASGSMFGNASTAPAFNFAKTSAPASSAPSAQAATPASGGFSLGSQPAATSSTTTPASTAPKSNFLSLGKSQDTQTATGATSTSSIAPTSNFFFNLGNSSGPDSSAKTSTAQATDASKPTAAESKQAKNMSASTAGHPPPSQSRLKNKSMDDIITRWATDLSKYQKGFQAQAEKVARWDRMLVENSEKIQKLYGQTLEAERATTEVERQLSAVESDQAELESWLNYYEKEVDGMIKQQGDGEWATGPDAERQRTYQLAGHLSEKLDEMGKDLTSMIEEINDASSNISKNSKKDDPLSQVVRVLNSHLVQLQQIDQGATALTEKVQDAQRATRTTGAPNGHSSLLGGANSDAADSFYRSYIGRR